MAFGGNNVAEGTDFKNGQRNGLFTIDYAYGAAFERNNFKPFDFFRFNAGFNLGGVQPPIGSFRIYAILYGKTSNIGSGGRFLWGIFNHYDYLENNVYQIGGTSVGLGIGYRSAKVKSVQYIGLLHGAVLLMGGANSDYSEDYKISFLDSARTYNMGPGATVKMENFLRFPFGALYLGYTFWWIHTWDGAPGNEFIGLWKPQLKIQIFSRWFLGLEWRLYHRVGKYDDYPNRNYRNNEQRLFIGYSF